MHENPNEPRSGSKLIDHWKEEIKSAVRYRTIYGRSYEWNHFRNMYRGFWGKGIVPVNVIYAVGRSIIPQVYFKAPRVSVLAKKPGYTPHAMVVERLDNYLIKETGLKKELKSGVLDCYLSGVGPGILGYDSEYGFNPSFTVGSDLDDSGLTGFSGKGHKIEYTENVHPGMPWFLRAAPEDFIVPWGTRRWEEARWFGLRKMRALRDTKEDPKYENVSEMKASFHTKLEGSTDGTNPIPQKQGEKDGDNEWVELWEIHDKRSGKIYVISLDHPTFLRNELDHLQIETLPAKVLGFNEDTNYFWWTPDARLIQVQQAEINDIRTMAKKHRRVGLLKMLYDKNINKDELAKLLDNDVKAAVGIDIGAQGDIRKSVAYLQSHVSPDLSIASKEAREDVQEIVGFSRNQSGSFEQAGGRRTAHEAEIVRSASLIRINERRDIMADHLESVIRGYNQSIFSFWGAERVVDIIGPDGARNWVRFTGEEIRGEFTYDINPEESLPSNQATRKDDALKFIEMGMKVPGFNMGYVLQQYARQFDWLDHKMLMPQSEGAGRSPEKALQFQDFQRKLGGGSSSFPSLRRP